MAKMSCPKCKNGKLEVTVLRNFETRLKGIPFVVEDAKVLQCVKCGEKVYAAKEIERWEQVQKNYLQSKGLLMTPEQVKHLRETIGFSVADLACLLGVTRQTVYSWESNSTGGVQLGPASLLLGLLCDEELNGNSIGALMFLVNGASQRGQRINASIDKAKAIAAVGDEQSIQKVQEKYLRDVPEAATGFVYSKTG